MSLLYSILVCNHYSLVGIISHVTYPFSYIYTVFLCIIMTNSISLEMFRFSIVLLLAFRRPSLNDNVECISCYMSFCSITYPYNVLHNTISTLLLLTFYIYLLIYLSIIPLIYVDGIYRSRIYGINHPLTYSVH